MAKPLKTTQPKDTRVNLRLPKDLRDQMADLARADGRSLSAYIERVLVQHVRSVPRRREAQKP
jgi:predicted HicB family RNase H-like nuclease